MIIGKWNKSVILTYIGLIFSMFGIFICITKENSINIAMCCLIISGICDLFDGFIARKCKRTEEEKMFGIQLDSLVDVVNFIAFPIVIFININSYYNLLAFIIFGICGIARLADFNIKVENSGQPIKYYTGLPVTYTALIFPLIYLLKYILPLNLFNIIFTISIYLVSVLNVLNIKLLKPKGIAYLFFSFLAIIVLVLYWGVL